MVNPHSIRSTCEPTARSVRCTETSYCTNCDVSGVHSHKVDAPVFVLTSSQGSPWYRHHRPRAPEPPISPPLTCKPPAQDEIDGSSTGYLSDRPIEDNFHSSLNGMSLCGIAETHNPHGKSLELPSSTGLPVHCDLDLPALEMDTDDQENLYDSDDFPLPPPPDGLDGPQYSSNHIPAHQLHRTPSPVFLGPLASITNILPNAMFFASKYLDFQNCWIQQPYCLLMSSEQKCITRLRVIQLRYNFIKLLTS